MLENAKSWPVFHPLTILDATEQLLTVPPALPSLEHSGRRTIYLGRAHARANEN
jgi:hypothetical protein